MHENPARIFDFPSSASKCCTDFWPESADTGKRCPFRSFPFGVNISISTKRSSLILQIQLYHCHNDIIWDSAACGHSQGRVNVTIRGRSAGGREEPLAIQPCSSTGFADYLLQGAIILAVTVAKISLSHKSTTLMERKTKT